MADSVHLDLFTPTAVTVKDVTDKKGNVWGNIHANHANGITRVTFEIPREAFVSLKVHSILGKEIIELAGKRFSPGRHTVEFKSGNIAKGMYLFSLKADKLSASGVMIY